MATQEEISLQMQLSAAMKRAAVAEQKAKRMQMLATRDGFFSVYFKALKETQKTNKEVFEMVNEEYYDFFGEFKYKSYETFRVLNHQMHKRRKNT